MNFDYTACRSGDWVTRRKIYGILLMSLLLPNGKVRNYFYCFMKLWVAANMVQ